MNTVDPCAAILKLIPAVIEPGANFSGWDSIRSRINQLDCQVVLLEVQNWFDENRTIALGVRFKLDIQCDRVFLVDESLVATDNEDIPEEAKDAVMQLVELLDDHISPSTRDVVERLVSDMSDHRWDLARHQEVLETLVPLPQDKARAWLARHLAHGQAQVLDSQTTSSPAVLPRPRI